MKRTVIGALGDVLTPPGLTATTSPVLGEIAPSANLGKKSEEVAEPVPGGLSLAETLHLIHAARFWPDPWVGADLMELAPTLDGAEASARVAVHLALHLPP